MRSFVRSSLALMGMSAVLAPVVAQAQGPAPAGYGPAIATMTGMDGKPVAVQPVSAMMPAPTVMQAPVQAPVAAPHKHRLRTLCARCAKKEQMAAMPATQIIACAHSKNGVCSTCRTLLEMPGAVTMGAAAPSPGPEAPGRASVSSGPTPSPSSNQYAAHSAPISAVYDPSANAEPAPIGVMQTNYAQPGAMAAAPSSIPTAASLQPGHSMAGSGASPAPFQHKSTSSVNPHVLGHIFGWSGFTGEWKDTQARRKMEAHASIPYNNEGTTINELPSSMVYGPGPR